MAHSYSFLYNMRCTGLRFFTVFGPWGRPDMALYSFVKNILKNIPIKLFNKGDMYRDFTYIDDAINYTYDLIKRKTKKRKNIQFEIFNIANSKPVHLKKFIKIIEKILKKKAKITYENNLKSEIKKTHADQKKLLSSISEKNTTSLEKGIEKFITWYKSYYNF